MACSLNFGCINQCLSGMLLASLWNNWWRHNLRYYRLFHELVRCYPLQCLSLVADRLDQMICMRFTRWQRCRRYSFNLGLISVIGDYYKCNKNLSEMSHLFESLVMRRIFILLSRASNKLVSMVIKSIIKRVTFSVRLNR